MYFDVLAIALLACAHAVQNRRSFRAAVVAQGVTVVYCLAYSAVLVVLVFFPNSVETPNDGEVSQVFKIGAIPFVVALIAWGILNVRAINPFVKGRRIARNASEAALYSSPKARAKRLEADQPSPPHSKQGERSDR